MCRIWGIVSTLAVENSVDECVAALVNPRGISHFFRFARISPVQIYLLVIKGLYMNHRAIRPARCRPAALIGMHVHDFSSIAPTCELFESSRLGQFPNWAADKGGCHQTVAAGRPRCVPPRARINPTISAGNHPPRRCFFPSMGVAHSFGRTGKNSEPWPNQASRRSSSSPRPICFVAENTIASA